MQEKLYKTGNNTVKGRGQIVKEYIITLLDKQITNFKASYLGADLGFF
jgi:hypothetical protein